MSRKFEFSLLLATCGLVVGCGSMPTKHDAVSDSQLRDGHGVILVSVANLDAGHCMAAATNLTVRGVGSGKVVQTLLANNPYIKSDFADHTGFVYAFSLDPGVYEFWLTNANPYAYYKNGHVGGSFQVVAGQAKYVGEFWIQGCGAVQTGFRDNWQQVKGTYSQVYPNLTLNSVRTDLVKADN
jgi:hypothetical protein